MSNVLTHQKQSSKPDSADTSKVRASDWNAGHKFTGGVDGAALVRDLSDATYGATWRSGVSWANVKDHGAVADGVTDNSGAFTAAQASLSPFGAGVVYAPRGSYFFASGLVLKQSNVTFLGDGMNATVFIATSGSIVQTDTNFQVSDIAFEGIGFDGSTTAIAAITIGRYALRGAFRASGCRFWRWATAGILIDSQSDVTIEDCLFHAPGTGKGIGINLTNACKNIKIRRNRFLWLNNGVLVDTGTTTSQSENVTEFFSFTNNYVDLGWWLITSRFAGSGGTVTYSSTVLTDTGATFSGLGSFDNIRIMPVLQTGTGTINRTKITDASATFVSNGVKRGHIVRMGTTFAVVMNVVDEHNLWVEDWLSDIDRLPVADPATGSYTVYAVYIGRRSSSTSTTITVDRWHDLDGNSVTPPSGTLYEVLQTHPGYPLNVEYSTRKGLVADNVLRRGWSDQCSVFSFEFTIVDNFIEDGQDMGLTLHGQDHIVSRNHIRRQGAGGIYTTAQNSAITANHITECPWVNAANTTSLGCLIITNGVQTGSGNNISDNVVLAGTIANPRHGIIVFWLSGSAVDRNKLSGNRGSGFSTAEFVVRGSGASNTRVYDCIGNLVVDTGATLADQRGPYGAATPGSAGAGAVIGGSDTVGSLTVGSAPGTPTITFKNPFNAAPVVHLQSTANNLVRATSVSGTGFTISGTVAQNDIVGWLVAGQAAA